MKLLVGTIILGAGISAFGQEATAPRQPVPTRLATDVILAGPMKQSPFTADESGETVRIMADGNRITESWTGKIARSSQGNVRREITSGKAGSSRPFIFGGASGVVAVGTADHAGHAAHVLMSKVDAEHAAARGVFAPSADGATGTFKVTTPAGTILEPKVYTRAKIETTAVGEAVVLSDRAEAVRLALPKPAEEGKYTTRKEELGSRDFGGVQADGVRVITTIAPGAVGNEREIEVTAETWFSKELGVVVYSKRVDPRVGETTYQMTNINRSEPDPSLFPTRK